MFSLVVKKFCGKVPFKIPTIVNVEICECLFCQYYLTGIYF